MLLYLLILICSIAGAACLVLGYAAVGGGMALGVGLLLALAWLLAYKRPTLCPPFATLALSAGLAGGGVFAGGSSWLMLFGATLALARWDLERLAQTLAGCTDSSPQTVTAFQNAHYIGLALTLGLSLLITLAGQSIRLPIPLPGIILLIIVGLFALDRAWRTLAS